ncbi:MAG: MBL fold metallo-hydrolase [Pseudomonadota bacterium]
MDNGERYARPIPVAEDIFWVGSRDGGDGFTCNPYLVISGDEAVLIDSGSRTDFAVVMMRILQAGIDPRQIVALIYHHYDPDLCGSMANFIDMCDNPELKVVSEHRNNVFISYYIPRDYYHLLRSVEDYDHCFSLGTRRLQFVPTPYSHSPGSFVTYDQRTRTLFSSDLFGSFGTAGDLFMKLSPACHTCSDFDHCPQQRPVCPLKMLARFHQQVMPCQKALQYAIAQLRRLDIACIAPQHGPIIAERRDIEHVMTRLEQLEAVGIDGIC